MAAQAAATKSAKPVLPENFLSTYTSGPGASAKRDADNCSDSEDFGGKAPVDSSDGDSSDDLNKQLLELE